MIKLILTVLIATTLILVVEGGGNLRALGPLTCDYQVVDNASGYNLAELGALFWAWHGSTPTKFSPLADAARCEDDMRPAIVSQQHTFQAKGKYFGLATDVMFLGANVCSQCDETGAALQCPAYSSGIERRVNGDNRSSVFVPIINAWGTNDPRLGQGSFCEGPCHEPTPCDRAKIVQPCTDDNDCNFITDSFCNDGTCSDPHGFDTFCEDIIAIPRVCDTNNNCCNYDDGIDDYKECLLSDTCKNEVEAHTQCLATLLSVVGARGYLKVCGDEYHNDDMPDLGSVYVPAVETGTFADIENDPIVECDSFAFTNSEIGDLSYASWLWGYIVEIVPGQCTIIEFQGILDAFNSEFGAKYYINCNNKEITENSCFNLRAY